MPQLGYPWQPRYLRSSQVLGSGELGRLGYRVAACGPVSSANEGEKLVRTAEAAQELSLDPSTLARWARQGIVTPAFRTAGGQARWNMRQLREQVAQHLQQHDQGPGTATS